MGGEEFLVGGFRFTSNFDSGNLARVEIKSAEEQASVEAEASSDLCTGEAEATSQESVVSGQPLPRPSTSSTLQFRSAGIESPEVEFQIWTKPDCHGTEFENGNRTWFFFGVEGGRPGTVLRFTMMNLNKQAKLFSQGMAPVYMPHGKSQWDRIRDPPTYETLETGFQMSFKFRVPDDNHGVTYFAFTYPYMYKELQLNLDKMHRRYSNGHRSFDELSTLPETTIYFHKETVIRSLEKRKMDLITLTGMNGLCREKEANLENLFAEERNNRPYKFRGKKIVFFSARVHPGETCSSHVINGLLKFLLRESDPRAAALRRKYVFKLVPMLNPDGVVNGHYRTDTRGVNLNRVYGNPSLELNPTIYAARKLILYAHLGREINEVGSSSDVPTSGNDVGEISTTQDDANNLLLSHCPDSDKDDTFVWEAPRPRRSRVRTSSSSRTFSSFPNMSPFKQDFSQWYEMNDNSRFSEGDESIADFSIPSTSRALFSDPPVPAPAADCNPNGPRTSFLGAFIGTESKKEIVQEESPKKVPELDDQPKDMGPTFPLKPGESGLFMYIDIHGHASKRGIFMYGNHFEDVETKVDALLYPKLMSINSANFDFPACNFTQRNMYMKDRHTGVGREGSGRVSVYKATGLPYCYTLECNFNTGRFTNCLPMASRDLGRASPPPTFDVPPKYGPQIYEETGKSLAISILDLTESNPWTRMTCSSCKNLKGVRAWIRSYIKNAETEAAAKSKSVKASPVRNRLRNLAGIKKSTIKQLKLSNKSPKSPETPRSLSKIPRKILTPKNSQCNSGKLARQVSSAGSTSDAPTSSKRNRPSSAKMKKLKRPGSKTSLKSRPKTASKSNAASRSTSPRRTHTTTDDKIGHAKSGSGKSSTKGSAKRGTLKSLQSSQSSPCLLTGSSRTSSANPKLKKLKKKKSVAN